MAQRLPDLMFVSTYWGYEQKLDADSLQPGARQMARLLAWDEARVQEEIRLALSLSGSV